MTDFAINDADPTKLKVFASAFHQLYADKGPDTELDQSEVRKVMALAIDALGPPALEFMVLVDPDNPRRPPDLEDLQITYRPDASDEVKAAVALVYCYRHPNQIAVSELDDAYSTLASSDMEHSPSP
jgi:hypothetical protein